MDRIKLFTLLMNTLPLQDLYAVPESVLNAYVEHGLFLYENSPYCHELSEEKFLQFVFYPRVNSEELTDCRAFFYDCLKDIVKGLGTKEAVLAVNRWCADQMTYQPSDDRTKSPMAAYRSGVGRCGEESVFLVTALRSVGIAARQIYVPWWSHCDDNHAWVEVYADGEWQFLGACEPEPVLNRGWFTRAATCAPIVCYRTFYPYTEDRDPEADREGCAILYNVTERYADTAELTVRMAETLPVSDVTVTLSVVNMSEMKRITSGRTDAEGIARFRVGKGCYRIDAYEKNEKGGGNRICQADIDLRHGEKALTVILSETIRENDLAVDSFFAPPEPTGRNRTVLSQTEQEELQAVLSENAKRRKEKAERYFLPEYRMLPDEWQEILRAAGGNAPEIVRFYRNRKNEEERKLALLMLRRMSAKDPADCSAMMLESWFTGQLPYCEKILSAAENSGEDGCDPENGALADALLNPRVEYEVLTDREALRQLFTEDEKQAYRKEPGRLYEDLKRKYLKPEGRYYPPLRMTPEASLSAGGTDESGLRILCTAALRVLGIPARPDPVTKRIMYFLDGKWHIVSAENDAILRLSADPGIELKNGVNYSLSVLTGKGYVSLGTAGSGRYFVPAGEYRLLTSARLPNGGQLVRESCFELASGEEKEVKAEIRVPAAEEMLSDLAIDTFMLKGADGKPVSSEMLSQSMTLFVFADPGKEPTVHILTELLESAEGFRENGLKTVLILPEGKAADRLIESVLEKLPDAVLYSTDVQTVNGLSRAVFTEPGVFPLLILTDRTYRCRFGDSGYRVGTAELILKLAACIRQTEESHGQDTV